MSEEYKKLKKAVERVEFLLSKYPACRNSDIYLVLVYWYVYHPEFRKYLKKFIPYDVAKKLTPPETIRRARQYIQNTLGRYPPTNTEVVKRRRKKEQEYREIFSQKAL
ncbi:hypothetical protein DRP04_13945 [Archaeoglobales archaeon]|nr:MAG: hypothetical protein DRP04_13945 [Archaeoglobales archaeon]